MTAGLFKMRSVVILGSDMLPSETTRKLTRSNTEMSTVQANRLLLTTPAYTYRISKLVDLERYRAVGRVENIKRDRFRTQSGTTLQPGYDIPRIDFTLFSFVRFLYGKREGSLKK